MAAHVLPGLTSGDAVLVGEAADGRAADPIDLGDGLEGEPPVDVEADEFIPAGQGRGGRGGAGTCVHGRGKFRLLKHGIQIPWQIRQDHAVRNRNPPLGTGTYNCRVSPPMTCRSSVTCWFSVVSPRCHSRSVSDRCHFLGGTMSLRLSQDYMSARAPMRFPRRAGLYP